MNYELGRTATTNDVASGFTTSAIMGNQRELALTLSNMQNYINQGFSGLNVQILTGVNDISRQLADCCCTTQRAIDNVNFNMERNTCAIKETINAQGDRVINWLTNEKIETQRDTIAQLRSKLAWFEHGCGCGCGCNYNGF